MPPARNILSWPALDFHVYGLCLCVCVCVCVCVHALSAFILGSIKALTRLCSCSGQELSLAADLILLRRICVFVCVCWGKSLRAGSDSGNRERWMRERQLLLCVCMCVWLFKRESAQEVCTDNPKMDEWVLSTVCRCSLCVCVKDNVIRLYGLPVIL